MIQNLNISGLYNPAKFLTIQCSLEKFNMIRQWQGHPQLFFIFMQFREMLNKLSFGAPLRGWCPSLENPGFATEQCTGTDISNKMMQNLKISTM